MDNELENLRYPVGRFIWPRQVSDEEIQEAIRTIEALPGKLKKAVADLSDAQLDTPYREGGWTVRQVVHHIADSHMNALIRFKLALTEESPTIKPYMEAEWAKHADATTLAPDVSLQIIVGVHQRWVTLMKSMSETDWDKVYYHPEHSGALALRKVARQYHWHSEHHLAHITRARERDDKVIFIKSEI